MSAVQKNLLQHIDDAERKLRLVTLERGPYTIRFDAAVLYEELGKLRAAVTNTADAN